MKLKLSLLAAAATIALSPAAHAYKGLYGSIGAGLTIVNSEAEFATDSNANTFSPFPIDSSAEFNNGFGIYTALGYAWGNGFRTEAEFAFRNNDLDQIDPNLNGNFSGIPDGSIDGEVNIRSYLFNVLYDIKLEDVPVTPYIGGGIGFAQVRHDFEGTNIAGSPTQPLAIAVDDLNGSLAYQAIVGFSYELASNLLLDLSYRYFASTSFSDSNVFEGTINGTPSVIEIDSNSHNFFAGLRWNFGSAPAAPKVRYKDCWDGSSVPVSSECAPQPLEETVEAAEPIQFTVYFDYDKSNLTSQASTLVQEASARALEFDVDTVVVQGNTDTSGSSAYNQALSARRAAVVRDALIANGIDADSIRIESLGENNLAKATPDGTREPLNRRSDVTISFE